METKEKVEKDIEAGKIAKRSSRDTFEDLKVDSSRRDDTIVEDYIRNELCSVRERDESSKEAEGKDGFVPVV